jgi:predicted RNA-binding protein YlqC (UPF0109 family)
VLYFSVPVVFIDEVLKFITTNIVEKPTSVKVKKD